VSTSSQNPTTDPRAAFIAGTRKFADWLEANPQFTAPLDSRFLLALHTNPAVEEFAAEHGLTVAYDDEGNASADLHFGPVVYHAYGYVDFIAHCERNHERQARRWAENKGLALVPQQTTAAGAVAR
jgi:hypothetical protein